MTLTKVRQFTVDEYHRITEAGILSTDERLELIEGQIIVMAAKNPPHAATNLCAANVLNTLLKDKALVRIQDPITLSAFSEPEPDIAVVGLDPKFYLDHHPTPKEVFLVIEVADTTQERDCGQKASLYAKAGIADYWVMDVNRRLIHQFLDPSEDRYRQEIILTEDDQISLRVFPEIIISIQQLFP